LRWRTHCVEWLRWSMGSRRPYRDTVRWDLRTTVRRSRQRTTWSSRDSLSHLATPSRVSIAIVEPASRLPSELLLKSVVHTTTRVKRRFSLRHAPGEPSETPGHPSWILRMKNSGQFSFAFPGPASAGSRHLLSSTPQAAPPRQPERPRAPRGNRHRPRRPMDPSPQPAMHDRTRTRPARPPPRPARPRPRGLDHRSRRTDHQHPGHHQGPASLAAAFRDNGQHLHDPVLAAALVEALPQLGRNASATLSRLGSEGALVSVGRQPGALSIALGKSGGGKPSEECGRKLAEPLNNPGAKEKRPATPAMKKFAPPP
jgi:hypothetical protein